MWQDWLVRLYRALLRAYPGAFRDRYGEAMEADARRLVLQRRAERGLRGVWSASWLIVRDLVGSAVRERLDGRKRTRPGASKARSSMVLHDIRHGVRVLLRAPGFAVAAILTVGLGIGATAAIFSVLYAVVLRPLPFPGADRLVRIYEVTPQGEDFSTSPPNVLDFRERSRTLEAVGALASTRLTLTGAGEPLQLSVTRVTPNVFGMLGAQPLLGRTFAAEAERPGGAQRELVLSEAFWRTRLGGDRDVIGSSLTLNGAPWTVIGVMPASFRFPPEQDGWAALPLDAGASRGDHRIGAIGLLRADATLAQADAELRGIASELGRLHPQSNEGWSVRLDSFYEWLIGRDLGRMMLVLQLAAGLLLLMACANVAHLLLVRACAREREMGVRAALGASRRRIVTQLLSESLLLALLSGAVGAALAYAGVPLLMRLSPPGLPRADDVAVSGMVLGFALVVTCIAGVLFGLLPALHLARSDLHHALRGGGRVATSGGRWVRESLLVGEIAVATMLLVGATLLLSSFARLRATDIGFATDNVLLTPVSLTSRYYAGCPADETECSAATGTARLLEFMRAAIERLEALPGVRRVGATNIAPLTGGSTGMEMRVEGYAPPTAAAGAWTDWRAVTSGFFEAAGLRLLRGRTFTTAEEQGDGPVVIVSESLARRCWPDADPIGKRIAFGRRDAWLTVIGVAGDMRDVDVQSGPRNVVYLAYGLVLWPQMSLLIRTQLASDALISDVRRTLWSIDPTLPLPTVRPLESYRGDALAGARFSLLLMAIFAATALVLGVLGVYGVTYFTVTRRTREFGVRLALGARRSALLVTVLGGTLPPVLGGVLLGLVGAWQLSQLIETLLVGTEPLNVRLYGAAGAVLTVVALGASLLPALRAMRVDPRVALSAE